MKEMEIKILNIDIENIKDKLNLLGAIFQKSVVQKIYTYDCYDPLTMYNLVINDYKITKSKNSLKKIINILEQLKPIINEEEKKIFKKICNYDYLDLYIKNNINIDLNILLNEKVLKIIESTKERFFKWIRLRKSGDKIELTVKYIYNTNKDYNIDDVKELEIYVNDFDMANKIIEEMGYVNKKLVEKKRTSYKLNNVNIEIDEWPLISPYVEIEGKNREEIYNVAYELGFDKKDIRIMNTEDVYIENNLNLTDYEILTFDESVKI